MIKVLRNVQKQLVLVQRARFCQAPNQNNQGSDNNASQEQQQQTTQTQAEKTHQAQQPNQQKENQREQKKHHNNQNNDQRETKQNVQQSNQSNVYGSKINAGNSEEIKKSIQKSVGDFSSSYKLNLNDKKQKVGNKQTFAKSENKESISQKKERLLKNITPTIEKLTDKNIGNVPIAQQIMVDRLKKYAMRVSDTKRIHEHLKEEEGVDFSYVEPRNLEILNSHIHRKSEEMEDLIATYLGVNQTLSRDEQLDEWRKQQAMDNVNVINKF